MMRTVILVPRRDGIEDRDKAWAWCKARWERYFPDIPIIEGHHNEGPFNRSAAVNTAARLAGEWDHAIVIDSDIFIRVSQVKAAVDTAAQTGRVTWAHRRWRGLREDMTRRIVADRRDFGAEVDREDMDLLVERTNPISWSCCIVFPRQVWDEWGGFDERFRGWGFEDLAAQATIVGLYGHERIEGDVYHLHHGREVGNGRADKAGDSYTADAITNARLGRRYMVALRRDHGLHDRPGLPSSEEERERDIANLKRDDAQLDRDAARLGLPDWTHWWPTLKELQAGAREYRERQAKGVTVIVHTGGKPENWLTRGAYLERSLRSLSANVTGPIIQRVVYDCWGDPAIRAQISAMAQPLGFYVAGPTDRPDYTTSMQAMWRYLARRAQGAFIFQAEDDFTYAHRVELEPMIQALIDNPHLTQMALLRDACYQDESETGGILGWPEPAFDRKPQWLEHRLFWTANPSLFRRSLTNVPWPVGNHSETLFGKQVLRDPSARSAFWGDASNPSIMHIGEVRAGSGY